MIPARNYTHCRLGTVSLATGAIGARSPCRVVGDGPARGPLCGRQGERECRARIRIPRWPRYRPRRSPLDARRTLAVFGVSVSGVAGGAGGEGDRDGGGREVPPPARPSATAAPWTRRPCYLVTSHAAKSGTRVNKLFDQTGTRGKGSELGAPTPSSLPGRSGRVSLDRCTG